MDKKILDGANKKTLINPKLLNDDHRRVFIKNADFKTLNEYLKNMEKLSKKGGMYLELYNKDFDYLLNNDIFNKSSDSLNMFFGNQSDVFIGSTETNIQNINKITNNDVNKYKNNFEELMKVETCIRNEQEKYGERHIKNSVKNFIDIIMTCSQIISDEESAKNVSNSFEIITSLIKDDRIAIREGYKYFSIVLKRNKDKIILDFIKKLNALNKEKRNIDYQTYKQEKINLIQNNVDMYGQESILTSILFNKIYNEYKKII